MAIRPLPRTYVCPHCGWSKTVHPQSDTLMPGDVFTLCPKCGGNVLSRLTSLLATVIGAVLGSIKKPF